MNLICLLKTIWHTTWYWISGGTEVIEGHTYKTHEVFLDRVVLIDKCEDCGHLSITHLDRTMYEVLKKEGKV